MVGWSFKKEATSRNKVWIWRHLVDVLFYCSSRRGLDARDDSDFHYHMGT